MPTVSGPEQQTDSPSHEVVTAIYRLAAFGNISSFGIIGGHPGRRQMKGRMKCGLPCGQAPETLALR